MVFKLFLALICGLPFSHFLFKPADLWHGQGHFFMVGILAIFCWSFIEKPKCVQSLNKPLGLFTLWLGIITAQLWMKIFIETKHYPIKIFMPFFNFLCFIWFYKLCLEYLDSKKLDKILEWFRYSVILVLVYSILQYFKLDQFMSGLAGSPDELVGTIGNTGHLAGYLAICQPIFFNDRLLDKLGLALLWIIIFLTTSASGLFSGVGVILFWLFMKRKYKLFAFSLSVLSFFSILIYKLNSLFFSSNHRVELWKLSYLDFKNNAITGKGLGAFRLMKYNILSQWGHAHNEYYQVAFEVGLIGLCLLLWCIWDYFRTFRTFRTDLTIKLACMFFGFCLLSLVSFPAHIWQLSILGMIGYSGIYVVKSEAL